MIVRILGEGQLDIPNGEVDALNELDDAVARAVEQGDEQQFRAALQALLAKVRAVSTAVSDDALVTSDLVLPGPDASVEEVARLLGDEGLIPG